MHQHLRLSIILIGSTAGHDPRTQIDLLWVTVGLEGFGDTQDSLCGVAVSNSVLMCVRSQAYILRYC
jgi:hypothetical protein